MKSYIYLDYAATTPMDPAVFQAMKPFFNKNFGNPSSLHPLGERAQTAIKNARQEIADILKCQPQEIIFTGSGTESINLALQGVALGKKKIGGHIITSAIEHSAVLKTLQALTKNNYRLTYLQPDKNGLINPQQVIQAITTDTILISLMYANNEIGVIQPLAEIGSLLKRKYPQIIFHSDACQAPGLLPLAVPRLHVDLLTINAHKLYGPKGSGLLYCRRGLKLKPLIYGGGQENNYRSGTENVPGIIGLAQALKIAERKRPQETKRLTDLRDTFIHHITAQIPTAKLYGHPQKRLANNIAFGFKKIDNELLLFHLAKAGVMASSGSACLANHGLDSPVIRAITNQADANAIRFSLGRQTTKKDLNTAAKILIKLVRKLTPLK